jgi:hypothetical protein
MMRLSRTRRLGLLGGLVGTFLAVTAVTVPAFGHEGEEDVPARTQVQTAVAILRTQPEQMDLAADRINDATEAEDKEGVDIDRVEQAKQALEAGDKEKRSCCWSRRWAAAPASRSPTPPRYGPSSPSGPAQPPPMSWPLAVSPSVGRPSRPW